MGEQIQDLVHEKVDLFIEKRQIPKVMLQPTDSAIRTTQLRRAEIPVVHAGYPRRDVGEYGDHLWPGGVKMPQEVVYALDARGGFVLRSVVRADDEEDVFDA